MELRIQVHVVDTPETVHEGAFIANGNLGQYLYISPSRNIVIVRTGNGWGGFDHWLRLFAGVSLSTRAGAAGALP